MSIETNVRSRAIAVIAEHVHKKPDEIKEEDRLSKLGMDSLDVIEVIMQLEDKFGINIPDEDSEDFMKVGDITSYLIGRLRVA